MYYILYRLVIENMRLSEKTKGYIVPAITASAFIFSSSVYAKPIKASVEEILTQSKPKKELKLVEVELWVSDEWLIWHHGTNDEWESYWIESKTDIQYWDSFYSLKIETTAFQTDLYETLRGFEWKWDDPQKRVDQFRITWERGIEISGIKLKIGWWLDIYDEIGLQDIQNTIHGMTGNDKEKWEYIWQSWTPVLTASWKYKNELLNNLSVLISGNITVPVIFNQWTLDIDWRVWLEQKLWKYFDIYWWVYGQYMDFPDTELFNLYPLSEESWFRTFWELWLGINFWDFRLEFNNECPLSWWTKKTSDNIITVLWIKYTF